MKKILLVDDSEPDRTLYRRYLSKHSGPERMEIQEAASGKEARAQFVAWRPDCVLLDYNLPDASGLDVLTDLLRLGPAESVCVVVITGGGSEVLAVQALNAGALDYLVKQQFDPDLLCKTVWHAIEKNEWRQYVASYHQQLRSSNQQLRDSLDELTITRQEISRKNDQLTAANAELARANRDLDNFVYAASHDLQQPVTNLVGLFEELRRGVTFHDPDAAQLLRLVEASLADLSTAITDLAAVVQTERAPETPLSELVEVAPLVAEAMLSLAPQIAATHAQIHTDFTALPAFPYGRSNLRTILLNLLSNALKYRHPDRVPEVQVRTGQANGQPVLEVQDNGLGIDLARHGTELFELFRRFHAQAASGTGVGLFLVNRLVQAQGGRIEVSSEPNQGTLFRLYLCA